MMIQWGSFGFFNRNNASTSADTSVNDNVDSTPAQNSFTKVTIPDSTKIKSGLHDYCDELLRDELEEKEKNLKDLKEKLDNNYLKKMVFNEEIGYIKTHISNVQKVIDDIRSELDKNEIQDKYEVLNLIRLEIDKKMSLINIPSGAKHDTLTGTVDVLGLALMGAWTSFTNNEKINSSTPAYNYIPIMLSAIPNMVKLMVLLKPKLNKLETRNRDVLISIYKSLDHNLEIVTNAVKQKNQDDARVEQRRFTASLMQGYRPSCEGAHQCLHPAMTA